MAARYLASNNSLCGTKAESIAETVFGLRDLVHNGALSEPESQDYWQYVGNVPASRILNGTRYSGTDASVQTFLQQWTSGCHATTGLIKSLLRVLNIPVEHFSQSNPSLTLPANAFAFSGHSTPHFLSENSWLSHGDDPYFVGLGADDALPFPLTALLVSDSQFLEWFPNSGSAAPNTIPGRQTDEIAIHYGSQAMLQARFTDLTANPSPPDKNICAYIAALPGPPNNYYSCAQAEALGLVSYLDSFLTPYVPVGSVALSSDIDRLPLYYVPKSQFWDPPCDTCVLQVCNADSACCANWSHSCESEGVQLCGGHECIN
jgi:hypothetical protein